MTTYNVKFAARTVASAPACLLTLSFGAPAQNDAIVKDAVAGVEALGLEGGKLCLLNGPASLPVAIAIGHAVAHRFGAVACFDPKMAAYVVAVSHDPERTVGSLIPAAEVLEG